MSTWVCSLVAESQTPLIQHSTVPGHQLTKWHTNLLSLCSHTDLICQVLFVLLISFLLRVSAFLNTLFIVFNTKANCRIRTVLMTEKRERKQMGEAAVSPAGLEPHPMPCLPSLLLCWGSISSPPTAPGQDLCLFSKILPTYLEILGQVHRQWRPTLLIFDLFAWEREFSYSRPFLTLYTKSLKE